MDDVMSDTISDQVILTPAATTAVKDLLIKRNLPNHSLRLFVSSGGCSGFQYGMALEENARPDDHIFTFESVKLVVNNNSLPYLSGATVDYINDIMGGGFKISNPNALASCGCGNSFRTKDNSRKTSSQGGYCNC